MESNRNEFNISARGRKMMTESQNPSNSKTSASNKNCPIISCFDFPMASKMPASCILPRILNVSISISTTSPKLEVIIVNAITTFCIPWSCSAIWEYLKSLLLMTWFFQSMESIFFTSFTILSRCNGSAMKKEISPS